MHRNRTRGPVRKMRIYNVKNMQDFMQQWAERSQHKKKLNSLLTLAF